MPKTRAIQAFIERMRGWYDEQREQGLLPEGFMAAVEATRKAD